MVKYESILKNARKEKGFTLVVAMILLVVITLLALGAMRSTTLQTRMAANLYDRGLAFQTAESALMAAQIQVASNSNISSLGGTSCTAADDTCPPVPGNTWNSDATGWTNVESTYRVNNTQYPAVAQYHVDYLGEKDVEDEEVVDQGMSGNSRQYGEDQSKGATKMDVYRITIRSNPSGGGGRSSVVLQSMLEVPK
jgi:type IV pilus assembly protein PilX